MGVRIWFNCLDAAGEIKRVQGFGSGGSTGFYAVVPLPPGQRRFNVVTPHARCLRGSGHIHGEPSLRRYTHSSSGPSSSGRGAG